MSEEKLTGTHLYKENTTTGSTNDLLQSNIKVYYQEDIDALQKENEQLKQEKQEEKRLHELDEQTENMYRGWCYNLTKEKQELIEYIERQLDWNIGTDDYLEVNIYTEILNKLKGDE